MRHLVVRAPDLEREYRLRVFSLEQDGVLEVLLFLYQVGVVGRREEKVRKVEERSETQSILSLIQTRRVPQASKHAFTHTS